MIFIFKKRREEELKVYKKNFYYMLVNLENVILVKGGDAKVTYSKFTKEKLSYLIDFVVSGVWTNSTSYKFIGRNYTLSHKELTDFWNKTHDQSKSESTFRVQHSKSAHVLSSLFGGAEFISDSFLGENELGILNIVKVVDAFKVGNKNIEEMFDSAFLYNVVADTGRQENFELSDCGAEMKFLSSIFKENLLTRCSSLDMSKLRFLINVLKRPIMKDDYVNILKLDCISSLSNEMQSDDSLKQNSIKTDEDSSRNISILTQTEDSDMDDFMSGLMIVGDLSLPSVVFEIMKEISENVGEYKRTEELKEEIIKVIAVMSKHTVALIRSDFECLDTKAVNEVVKTIETNEKGVSPILAEYQAKLFASEYSKENIRTLLSYIDSVD